MGLLTGFWSMFFQLIAFNLEYFTDNGDLNFLVDMLAADPRTKKFARLNGALVNLIEDFPFVGYHTLNIQDKESVVRLLRAVDKSNGYIYANLDVNNMAYDTFIGKPEKDHRWTMEVQERYMKR